MGGDEEALHDDEGKDDVDTPLRPRRIGHAGTEHALAAAGSLYSAAAVRRLVTVTLDGLPAPIS